MNVRHAEIDDVPGILKLLVQVDMVHHNGRPDLFKGPATKYNEEELKEIIKCSTTPVFVCVDEQNEVCGHAFCIHKQEVNDSVLTDIKTLYIDDICVDENARGKQIGKALYEHVRNYAESIGCNNITLNVWEGNDPAWHFYKDMGMQVQKTTMEIILKNEVKI
jgi:ribosomal protein S18 acetylase RimI-like enzyme